MVDRGRGGWEREERKSKIMELLSIWALKSLIVMMGVMVENEAVNQGLKSSRS